MSKIFKFNDIDKLFISKLKKQIDELFKFLKIINPIFILCSLSLVLLLFINDIEIEQNYKFIFNFMTILIKCFFSFFISIIFLYIYFLSKYKNNFFISYASMFISLIFISFLILMEQNKNVYPMVEEILLFIIFIMYFIFIMINYFKITFDNILISIIIFIKEHKYYFIWGILSSLILLSILLFSIKDPNFIYFILLINFLIGMLSEYFNKSKSMSVLFFSIYLIFLYVFFFWILSIIVVYLFSGITLNEWYFPADKWKIIVFETIYHYIAIIFFPMFFGGFYICFVKNSIKKLFYKINKYIDNESNYKNTYSFEILISLIFIFRYVSYFLYNKIDIYKNRILH